jgi:hypothetical protein
MSRAVPQHRPARSRDDAQSRSAKPAPAAVERLLQLQRSAGNAAVARAIVARQFDRHAYERSMAEKAKFMAWLWEGPSWRPSTGLGNFDILYEPKTGVLTVTVKCRFKFKDGKPEDFDDEDEPKGWLWKPAETAKWKADFMRRVSAKWSGQFTFHCTRDWWEELQAAVQVRFVESDAKHSHYDLQVAKIPEVDSRRSRVRRPKHNKNKGRAFLDSSDLDQEDKGDHTQTVAFHEAGHMLGLGDEYSDSKNKDQPVAHEKLVQAEFGHGVPRHDDGRLMSEGDLIGPEYGVTFLEALRVITDMPQWNYNAKPPATVLSEPVDGPMPHKQDPVAPTPPQVAVA